ncbi:MAG: hypothetical protein KGJ02_03395, partial [Verrucomicrobiota bacterium]|nr:hypothetical protein [Verrucomicrobiota bacterium]
LETSGARQHFLNEISRNVSAKTVKVTTDYRKNLIRYTGFDPGKAAEAHHVFPQAFRKVFFKKGIMIDDAKYLSWWEKTTHRANWSNYNREWESFLKANPDGNAILKKGYQLSEDYGFLTNY